MTLKSRLLNVARAELLFATRRLREAARWRAEEKPKEQAEAQARLNDPQETLRRYYANLELPLGAPLQDVKSAYRRLMRRYHPDLHANNPNNAEAATQLARELRIAYEGLLNHLEKQP